MPGNYFGMTRIPLAAFSGYIHYYYHNWHSTLIIERHVNKLTALQ